MEEIKPKVEQEINMSNDMKIEPLLLINKISNILLISTWVILMILIATIPIPFTPDNSFDYDESEANFYVIFFTIPALILYLVKKVFLYFGIKRNSRALIFIGMFISVIIIVTGVLVLSVLGVYIISMIL